MKIGERARSGNAESNSSVVLLFENMQDAWRGDGMFIEFWRVAL